MYELPFILAALTFVLSLWCPKVTYEPFLIAIAFLVIGLVITCRTTKFDPTKEEE